MPFGIGKKNKQGKSTDEEVRVEDETSKAPVAVAVDESSVVGGDTVSLFASDAADGDTSSLFGADGDVASEDDDEDEDDNEDEDKDDLMSGDFLDMFDEEDPDIQIRRNLAAELGEVDVHEIASSAADVMSGLRLQFPAR